MSCGSSLNPLPSEFKRIRGLGLLMPLPGSVMKVNQWVVMLVRGQQPMKPSVDWAPEHCQGLWRFIDTGLEILL